MRVSTRVSGMGTYFFRAGGFAHPEADLVEDQDRLVERSAADWYL